MDTNWKHNDVVYWVNKNGWWPDIHWGVVDEIFSDGLYVTYLEPYERRRVNGIPIDQFESETKYHKLPKGWTYNTKLFEITYDDYPEGFYQGFNITDPEVIKDYYSRGYLVPSSTIFHGEIKADITRDGYKILKTYPVWYMSPHRHLNNATVPYNKAFKTYVEAKQFCDDEIAEYKRQAALSDEEWSIEQIKKELSRWKTLYCKSDESYNSILQYLLSKPYIDQLEVRLFDGNIQWKYEKNKKWYTLTEVV